jgi:XTP/dITP diphosphohydrolase
VVDVAFVTTNAGKFVEAQAILRPYGVRLRRIRRALSEPQSDDLAEVARAKAAAVRGVRGYVLVEDAGLFIRSLQGFPGIYSAHFLRIWGFPNVLKLLEGRPRSAEFRSAVVLRRGAWSRTFLGRTEGTIARAPRGDRGFGYDPIFLPKGYRSTFAELPASVKNEISHRAQAMAQAGEFLRRTAR